jgi:hypothetical protein
MSLLRNGPGINMYYSGWLNLDPAEIRVLLNAFYDFETPEKKKKAKPGAKEA